MVRQRDTDGGEGRQNGRDVVEVGALRVFLLLHQQKPVGEKVQ